MGGDSFREPTPAQEEYMEIVNPCKDVLGYTYEDVYRHVKGIYVQAYGASLGDVFAD